MTMKTAMVSELKAKLSGFLAEVRRGETITVCDRQTPIARLAPLDEGTDGLDVREPDPDAVLPLGLPIRVRGKIDVIALLRDERGQR